MLKKLKYLGLLAFNLTFVATVFAQAKNTDTTTYNKKQLPLTGNVKLTAITPQHVLPQNYNAKNLPFFCRKEWQIEKATKLPIRFRLGSVADCNKLEGKQ